MIFLGGFDNELGIVTVAVLPDVPERECIVIVRVHLDVVRVNRGCCHSEFVSPVSLPFYEDSLKRFRCVA